MLNIFFFIHKIQFLRFLGIDYYNGEKNISIADQNILSTVFLMIFIFYHKNHEEIEPADLEF